MVNLRMFAIASALLLIPAAYAVVPVPGGTVLEYYGEAAAYVEDVVITSFPAPVTGRTGDFREEQLVEGHTTFVTLDIEVEREQKNGTIDIEGYIRCEHKARVNFTYLGGYVPFPTYVDYAGSECRAGEQVVIVPDPFVSTSSAFVSPLQPTGRILTFTAPNGQSAYMEELTFHTLDSDDWGEPVRRDYYAWTSPILPAWISHDGRPKSFFAPLPEDRLREMGVEHFQVVFERDVR